ncbi:MAG: 16S rRNA (adenine(1518)-N(6)/adenine(1519)-N(6))-dimethyltransferase, partial [Dehalococcoidia bacterium]
MTQTKGLLRHFDLRARKRLGQHFLIDEEVLKFILSAAELAPADVVMEVGPGLGVLTKELAKKAGWVVTVELDNKLAAMLKQTLASFNNVAVINGDVLEISPEALLREQKGMFSPVIDP